jgi:hypothetical protein
VNMCNKTRREITGLHDSLKVCHDGRRTLQLMMESDIVSETSCTLSITETTDNVQHNIFL